MGTQLKISNFIGELNQNSLTEKQNFSNWLIKIMQAENNKNQLMVFELPKLKNGKPNNLLIDKIEKIIKECNS